MGFALGLAGCVDVCQIKKLEKSYLGRKNMCKDRIVKEYAVIREK